MDHEGREEEEEEEEVLAEGGTDPTSHLVSTGNHGNLPVIINIDTHQHYKRLKVPGLSPEGGVPSWESPSWPALKRDVAVHLHPAGLDAENFSHKFRVHDQQLLLQLVNLHPARWRREQTPETRAPLSHHGYYHLTILGKDGFIVIISISSR